MVSLAACSGDDRPTHDGISVADAEPDSEADTEAAGADVPCTPNTTTCARGVVATCRDGGGGWIYSACPAGQVCEVDECVDNVPAVVIVAMASLDDQGIHGIRAIPGALETAVESALCDDIPSCCDRFRSALARPGNEAAQVATKYWLRRLLRDLDARGTFSVSLLGPPSRLNPVDSTCLPPTSVDPCLEGAPDLMRFSDWQAVEPEALPTMPVVSGEQARVLLDASVRQTDSTPDALLSWVDGVFAQDALGETLNPELNTRQAGPYDYGLITWLYLATEHRPEGRKCAADSDCGHRHYRCVDEHCTDPAAACRTQDVVLLGSFLDRLQITSIETSCYVGGVGGVDWDVWARWLRWGVSCAEERDCRVGSTCMDPCDVSDYPQCSLPDACMPEDLIDQLGDDPLLASAIDDFTDWLPSAFARDSAGREFAATFHAIFTGMAAADPVPPVAAVQYATRAALLGGGVAVTPTVPELMPYVRGWLLDSPFISIDYEARYRELVEAISARLDTSVCTPKLVGLGDGP
ncbi:MAG: hypothetical protein IT360_25230 [Gemmatimonadaceae bacterium]|nr:hypothetical protein [Gemmatimonadaceae bacterium]